MISGDVNSCRLLFGGSERLSDCNRMRFQHSLANRWTVWMEAVEGVGGFCPGQESHNGPLGGIIDVSRAQKRSLTA